MNIFELSSMIKKHFHYTAWSFISLLMLTLLSLQACDTTSANNSKATINVNMTDAPAGFKAVTVTINEIDIHKNGTDSTSGWQTISTQPVTVNLLNLANGKTKLIGSNIIDAGDYSQIRLLLGSNNSVTTLDGTTHSLTVPSGSQTGIKVNANITVNPGDNFNLLLDFNAAQSVHVTGNGRYMLKPVIHSVTLQTEGSVSGVVLPALARSTIYAINNQDTVSSTSADTSSGNYKLVGLPVGTYDLAFNPADTLYNGSTLTGVQVMANNTTQVDTVKLSHK